VLESGDQLLDDFKSMAIDSGTAIVYPSVEAANGALYNTTYLIASDGSLAGAYRKTHLTFDEKTKCGLTPGDELPVFELKGVRVAVMTCYDGYFREVARIFAIKGAQIIFWPSLQRGSTEDSILLQARSRALDNAVFIARSSYGHPHDVPWSTGMSPGASCVVDREGRIIVNAGLDAGFVIAKVDCGAERSKPRSFGSDCAKPSAIIREDRRPELYSVITDSQVNITA
ncbi:MAG: carbon-nitrogen hydrolase family protein, partial [Victivallales bacterium]|nr:carbon-nitrogen hydrolase family protein [Victivallales bacterium]